MIKSPEYLLTVFANFRIDSDERFLRMKDSFFSFREANIERWVINIRGDLKNLAADFLRENLKDKLVLFELNSSRGWFFDSNQMFSSINTSYVFFWIEDHICLCGPNTLNNIIKDMGSNDVDYLGYSWYGMGKFLDEFKGISGIKASTLVSYKYDKAVNRLRQSNSKTILGRESYIISACGIFARSFMLRILNAGPPFPRRWPKETPFDFEKDSNDTFYFPITYGVPTSELFAAIDDDNKHPGSSLISRGLYPNRASRVEMLKIRDENSVNQASKFKKLLINTPLTRWVITLLKRISYSI